MYCEHALTNWQVSSLTFSTSPCPSLKYQHVLSTIVPVPKNTKVTWLNDYRPVALMSVAMKCFERLIMAHINTIIPETLDPLQLQLKEDRARPLLIGGAAVDQFECFRSLCVHITTKLTWCKHTKIFVKRAQHNYSPSGDGKDLSWVLRSSKCSTAAPSRAS